MDTRDTYIAKMKAQLDSWKAQLDQLESQASNSQASQEMNDKIAELKKHRDEAQLHLNNLQQATGEAWEQVKNGVEAAWTHITTAVSNAGDQLKKAA